MFLKKSVVICSVILYLFSSSLIAAAEQIVALGRTQPISSSEGEPSILAIYKLNTDIDEDDSFQLEYVTSSLELKLNRKTKSEFEFGAYSFGEVISEGNGDDIYNNGERQEEITFNSNSLAIGGYLKKAFDRKLQLGIDFSQKKTFFYQNDKTSYKTELPKGGYESNLKTELFKEWKEEKNNYKLGVVWETGSSKRDTWRTGKSGYSGYNRQIFKAETKFNFLKNNKTEAKVKYGRGDSLGFFSAYRIGGMAGKNKVGGFYRNEFRAKELLLANFSHEIAIVPEKRKERKLMIDLDYADFKRIDLDYLAGSPKHETIGSLGIGFYYAIEQLKGLPLIIKYAEGINIHSDSKSSKRKELLLMLAAKF